MAYQSWSVVFGEQPSGAKWNILGTNDASFNDGSGFAAGAIGSDAASIAEDFFRGKHQANTTNTTPTGLTVQFGWGYIVGDTTTDIEETVTFPTAFASVPIFVTVSPLGARATASGAPDSLDDFNTEYAGNPVTSSASDIATTGFLASLYKPASTFSSSFNFGYTWMAIGTV